MIPVLEELFDLSLIFINGRSNGILRLNVAVQSSLSAYVC